MLEKPTVKPTYVRDQQMPFYLSSCVFFLIPKKCLYLSTCTFEPATFRTLNVNGCVQIYDENATVFFFKKFRRNYFKKWGKIAIFNNFYKIVFLLSTIGGGVKIKFMICTFVWCSIEIKKVVFKPCRVL